ncbi:hypothetical protein [Bacillus alkalicellulosilyticus]|uniref:hypothetical protein n=1 Tax=Alkalihalobacterium alkalicellulosilyticum TaxID=1912214 RepID=UPI000996473F|nr:hypothetical protein [Bacillus alkalicellulosilyticus]
MKSNHFLSIAILLVLFLSLYPVKTMATSWAYSFVVWDGYVYVISDEYVTEIGDEIGRVTRYSDMKQYSGNFSNAYKKGTKYYSIEGISTEQAIAVEDSNGQYIKAYRQDEYKVPLSSSFGDPQVMMNTIVLLGLGLLSFILIGKVIKNNRGKRNG